MKSIRSIYENIGVEKYYSNNTDYKNPHAREVTNLIIENRNLLSLNNVLDLACGTGLVTNVLKTIGYYNIIGIDPFLHERYTTETGFPCYKMSFKDIVNKGLPQNDFSCIICSFALHLCEKSMLHDLMWRLSEVSNTLVVISPSKFPLIGKPSVEKFCFTSNKKRIQFRLYNIPI